MEIPMYALKLMGLLACGAVSVGCIIGVVSMGYLLRKSSVESRDSKLRVSIAATFFGALFGVALSFFSGWALIVSIGWLQ